MGLLFVTNGVLRGSGDMAVSMASTIVNLVVRVAAAYYLSSKPAIGFSRNLVVDTDRLVLRLFCLLSFAIAVVNGPEKGVVNAVSRRTAEAETLSVEFSTLLVF